MGPFWSHISHLFCLNNKKEFTLWNDFQTKELLKQETKLSELEHKYQLFEDDFRIVKVHQKAINLSGVKVLTKSDESMKNDNICGEMFPHEDENKWFLPQCDRQSAQRLLKGRKEGTFLVRKSENLDGKYVLSIVIRSHIKHIVIHQNESGYCLHGDERHPTLLSLIMFYAQPFEQQLDTTFDSCKNLHFPVFQ